MKNRFTATVFFGAILALVLVIYYLPWLTGQASFYLFDITNIYEPTLKILAENWRQGQFMLWNPYSYCGMPQIAVTEPGLFYPPNWMFAFLSFNQGLAFSLIFHQLLAGVGSFLLVAGFGWGILPACFAGLTAGLCGYMFSLQTNYTLMAAAAWIPLLLFSLRCVETQVGILRVIALAAVSFSTSLMILTGRPEIFGPALILIGMYVVFSFAIKLSPQQSKTRIFVDAFLQVASMAIGVLMAAPGILPAVEWLPLSPRAEGLVPADTLFWSANWYDFLCLVLPQPLGDLYLRTNPFANLALANPGLEPYFASAFIGPIVITLALVGMCDRQFRPRWYLLCLLVSFLIFAAGRFTPLGEFLLYAVPGVGVLRYPVKLLFFPVFCLILFAVRGLFVVFQGAVPKSVQITSVLMWAILLITGLLLVFVQVPLIADMLPNAVTFLRLKFALQLILDAQQLIGKAFLTMAAVGLTTCFICWLKQVNKIGAGIFSAAVLVSTCALFLYHAFAFAYHPANPDYFEQKCYLERQLKAQGRDLSKLENLNGERFITMYIAGLLQPNGLETGDAVQKTIAHYQANRQVLYMSSYFHQHYASSWGYLLAETNDYRNLYVDTINKSHVSGKKLISKDGISMKTDLPFYRFCQITSTAYALGLIDKFTFGKFSKTGLLDPNYFELLVEDPSWNERVYRVKDPMPRAYLSYRWQWLNSQDQALKTITNAETTLFDPAKETLLEKHNSESMPLPSSKKLPKQDIKWLDNSANRVQLEVSSSSPGLLVLTDHFYPGWIAKVDSKQIPIFRANGLLRGVFVPEGKHAVEFLYEPTSLKTALAIAFVGLLVLIVIAFAAVLFDKCFKE
ncbi:MAG: YfhO family protein [Candidatus Obscuribacterales bacterium]|nr:YfhO family protein [Candidatus Obscuribacterales bacterium]